MTQGKHRATAEAALDEFVRLNVRETTGAGEPEPIPSELVQIVHESLNPEAKPNRAGRAFIRQRAGNGPSTPG